MADMRCGWLTVLLLWTLTVDTGAIIRMHTQAELFGKAFDLTLQQVLRDTEDYYNCRTRAVALHRRLTQAAKAKAFAAAAAAAADADNAERVTTGDITGLDPALLLAVSYTHLTLPTIYSV